MFITKSELAKEIKKVHARIDNSLANAHMRINETNKDLRTVDANMRKFAQFLAEKHAGIEQKLVYLLTRSLQAKEELKVPTPTKSTKLNKSTKKVATKTKKNK